MLPYRLKSYRFIKGTLIGLRYLILTLLSVVVAFPLVWMFVSSVKPVHEIISIPPTWIPTEILWENYSEAWNYDIFDRYFLNSAIFTITATMGALLFASMAGYGFTKFRWRGREASFVFVLSTMMLPIEVTMIPLFLVVKSLGWVNSYQGLIVPMMITPFAVFYMRQFIYSIPSDYIDSARIDGASELQIYRHVILPLALPAIAGLGMMQALSNWDQLLWPLIINSADKLQVLTVGVAKMQSNLLSPIDLRIAISVIMCLPMLFLLMVGQRKLMEMSSLSGLKG